MVSKAVCTSAQGAIQYFENHLNLADYFAEGEKIDRGQFMGRVAERLGLDGAPITREKFGAFAQCDMLGLGAESKRQRTSEIKFIEFTYVETSNPCTTLPPNSFSPSCGNYRWPSLLARVPSSSALRSRK